jgi:hypothetical protein
VQTVLISFLLCFSVDRECQVFSGKTSSVCMVTPWEIYFCTSHVQKNRSTHEKGANIACTTTVVKCKSLTRRKRMDVLISCACTVSIVGRSIYLSPLVLSSLVSFFVDHQLPIYLDMLVVVTSSVYNVTESSVGHPAVLPDLAVAAGLDIKRGELVERVAEYGGEEVSVV